MFLLVSVRHVGAHPGGHQHGVSVQISINLGKTFLRISRIRNILLAWILARVFVCLPPFISLISDYIYWTVLIFSLILNSVTMKTSNCRSFTLLMKFNKTCSQTLFPKYVRWTLGEGERWDHMICQKWRKKGTFLLATSCRTFFLQKLIGCISPRDNGVNLPVNG